MSVQSPPAPLNTPANALSLRVLFRRVIDAVIAERQHKASQLIATYLRDHKVLTSEFRVEFERRLIDQ